MSSGKRCTCWPSHHSCPQNTCHCCSFQCTQVWTHFLVHPHNDLNWGLVHVGEKINFPLGPCSVSRSLARSLVAWPFCCDEHCRSASFMVPRSLVQVLHPPQKFEFPSFCNGGSYGINRNGGEVTFNDMIYLNFIKIYQLVQKLLRGDTDRMVIS
jgi:hypothetical protein